jgi:uncharacterized membrane protein
LTASRLLDTAALGLAVALLSALVHWWVRPEIVFLVLLGVVTARLLVAPVAVPAFDPRRILLAGMLAYAAGFSFITVSRHLTFLTHALDLGYYVQLTWNLAGGRGARVSLPEMHAWGDHLSPIMYAFVPLFWVAPGPVALLIAQSVALALGALAVFALARRRLGDERSAAAFALLYLVNPSLHGINVRDFHAAALAIPLLLVAIHAGESGRLWLLAVATALTLACREDAAVPVIGLGAWLAIGRRRWLCGTAVAALALTILVVDVRWVIPLYRAEPYPHLGRYAHLGASFAGILVSLALHPLQAVAGAFSGERLAYLLALLAPLGFLPLLAPLDLLGALPGLAENLLATDPILYSHRTQYQAFVLPFLIAAAIVGHARVTARWPRWRAPILALATVASLALAARTVNNFAVARWWPEPATRAARSLLARVPPAAPVSAQDPYVPHLSLRPLVFVFPVGIDRSEYIVLNSASYPWRNLPDVSMERGGDTVTITMPGGARYRYTVAGEAGPHLLLRTPGAG